MPPAAFQYVRRFDSPPVKGEPVTVRMTLPSGGETVFSGTYEGTEVFMDDTCHVVLDVVGIGPRGPFASPWSAFPVSSVVG
jgi:hypothetical protein